ncbi:MAG TPA: hypothetical protein VM662_09245 [Sphingomonas sp.]|nr:hypothetical protein [Sphingomonas sp.]
MTPEEADALGAIRARYSAPVTYTGAGLNGASIPAIRSDSGAATAQGLEGRAARVSFEIETALLPQEPRIGNLIVEADGGRWSVIDRAPLPDVAAWLLFVETAP